MATEFEQHDIEPHDIEQQAAEDRRRFLISCGKFAAITPPAMTVLLSTSLTSSAVALSGGRSASGYGSRRPGSSIFDNGPDGRRDTAHTDKKNSRRDQDSPANSDQASGDGGGDDDGGGGGGGGSGSEGGDGTPAATGGNRRSSFGSRIGGSGSSSSNSGGGGEDERWRKGKRAER